MDWMLSLDLLELSDPQGKKTSDSQEAVPIKCCLSQLSCLISAGMMSLALLSPLVQC